MIDEPLRGAEGLQGEWAGSGCSCQGAPILGGSRRDTSAQVLGDRLTSRAPDKPTCATYLGDGGREGRPG